MENKTLVERIGYIGGQEDELGCFCQALIVRVNDQEKYVLHSMSQYGDGKEIRDEHKKVEFSTRRMLKRTFERTKERLGIDKTLKWEPTTPTCGYEIAEKDFPYGP